METAQRRATISKLSRIPGYADGGVVSPWSIKGIVNTVKKAVTKTPEQAQRDAEMAEYRANAEAERKAAKATPAAPAATNAITAYAGSTAADRRMAEVEGKADGGPITGPGGPTEDKVHIMASPGEFVIRAAAVEKIGLPALRALNALGGNLPKAPNRNDRKYAEGDLIQNDQQKLANQTAMYVEGAKAANPEPAAKPFPQSPTSPDALHSQALQSAQSLAANKLAKADSVPQPAPVAAQAPVAPQPQSDYSRQMGEMGSSFMRGVGNIGRAAKTMALTAVSAPGYGLSSNNPTAPTDAVPYPGSQPAPKVAAPAQPQLAELTPAAPATDTREPYQPKYPVKDTSTFVTPQAPVVAPPTRLNPEAQAKEDAFNTRMDSENAAVNARMQAEIARGKALPSQYEKEVAQAQAINEAGRRMNLEYDLKNGNLKERQAALAILSSIDATEKDKRGNAVTTRGQDMGLAQHQMSDLTAQRGQNVTARGQDLNAAATNQSQKLARDRFGLDQAKDGREAAASAMTQKSMQQLMDAQQEYLNAKTPEEQKAAERKLITLGGKQPNDKGQVISLPDTLGDMGQVVRGGQAVLMPDGRLVRPEQAGAKPKVPAEGSISTVNGKTAKFIGGKWVPQ